MAREIELQEGEVVEKEVQGDYWEKLFLFMYDQKRGHYWFTNQRISFQGGFVTALDIPYSEIASVSECCVGGLIPFVPTGVKVDTKDGNSYKLSVLKRKEIIEFIQSKI